MLKKKMVSISLALGLCLSSITAFADSLSDDSLKLFNEDTPTLETNLDKEKASEFIQLLKDKETTMTTRGPAPKLSYLEVFAVGSTQYLQNFGGSGYEYIDRYQFSTKEDHGGNELIIVTAELGMSSSSRRIAELNGKKLELIRSEYIDNNNDSIIDGFFHYWNARGNSLLTDDSGDFSYTAWSLPFPYNEMFDGLYIK